MATEILQTLLVQKTGQNTGTKFIIVDFATLSSATIADVSLALDSGGGFFVEGGRELWDFLILRDGGCSCVLFKILVLLLYFKTKVHLKATF